MHAVVACGQGMQRAHRAAIPKDMAHEALDLQVIAAVTSVLLDFHERVHTLPREVELKVRAAVEAPKV